MSNVIEPCEHCGTWRWCARNGCVARCEESARRLSDKEEAEAALADFDKNGGLPAAPKDG